MAIDAPARSKRRPPWVVRAVAAGAVLLLAGLGSWLLFFGTLSFQDPAGARACSMLSDALSAGGMTLKTAADIGDVAKDSTTSAIRAAVDVDASRGQDLDALADLDRLRAACVAEGVSMPS